MKAVAFVFRRSGLSLVASFLSFFFPVEENSFKVHACVGHFKSRRRKSWVVFANDLNHKAGYLRREF